MWLLSMTYTHLLDSIDRGTTAAVLPFYLPYEAGFSHLGGRCTDAAWCWESKSAAPPVVSDEVEGGAVSTVPKRRKLSVELNKNKCSNFYLNCPWNPRT